MSLELDTGDTERPPPARLRGFLPSPAGDEGHGPVVDLFAARRVSAGPLPAEVFLQCGRVLHQRASDCVWESGRAGIYTRGLAQGVQGLEMPAGWWGYAGARALAGESALDIGCRPTLAAKFLYDNGYPSEKWWPYEQSGPFDAPPPDAFTYAKDQAGKLRQHRATTVEETMRCLANGVPVQDAGGIDQAYEEYRGGIWRLRGSVLGGHARLLVGYRWINGRLVFIEQGSWGADDYGISYAEASDGRAPPHDAPGGFVLVDAEVVEGAQELWTFDLVPTPSENNPWNRGGS